jgi:hypothetical protein
MGRHHSIGVKWQSANSGHWGWRRQRLLLGLCRR